MPERVPANQVESPNRRSPALFLLLMLVGSLLGLCVYVAVGPMLLMRRFGESLSARDAAAIAECVDFPKLRESIKEQVNSSVKARSNSLLGDNPLTALATGLAASLSEPLVDSLVTPAGLEKLLAGGQLLATLGTSSTDTAASRAVAVPEAIAHASYSFRSPSEFVVTLEPKPKLLVELVVERTGLSWRISGVRLPE